MDHLVVTIFFYCFRDVDFFTNNKYKKKAFFSSLTCKINYFRACEENDQFVLIKFNLVYI